jgi:Flp pilus assembly pilin Flp
MRKRSMISSFGHMLVDDSAQGLLEYILIVSIVSIAAIAALKFLGGKTNNTMANDSLMLPG